jgi:biopolymer transport protein ExbD
VDHRADIYALGVVFYQMLTGELPGKKIEPPSKKVHIDVRLDEVVLRALEKKPELRYQQASVLKTQVETIAETPGSSGRESAQTESPASLEGQSRLTSAATSGESRFSHLALVGGAWAASAGLVFGLQQVGISAEAVFLIPGKILTALTLSAPLATTILGWVAVTQIRRSAGKLHGLELAVFDGLLFPLVALNAAILWPASSATRNWERAFQATAELPPFSFEVLFWLLAATLALASIAIIRRVWRAVNQPCSRPTLRGESAQTDSRTDPENQSRLTTAAAGSIGFAAAVTFFYAGVMLSILLIGILPFRFNRDSAYLFGVGLMLVVAPFVGMATTNALHRAREIGDRDRLNQVKSFFRFASVLAWVLAVPVVGFAGFFLVAMFSERGGWNPAPSEAALVPLTWLGAILLPISGVALWRAAALGSQQSGEFHAESKNPSPSFWTWSPLQSREVGEISSHLTKAERNHVSVLGLVFGSWIVVTCFGLPAFLRAFAGPGKWIVAAIWAGLFLVSIQMWQRMMRHFLCSTTWAKQQGYTPEKLRLFSFGGKNLLVTSFVLGIGLFLIFVQNHAVKNYLGLAPTPPRTLELSEQPEQPGQAAGKPAFGPSVMRVIQAGETATNLFLNLDTGELLTPPSEIQALIREPYLTRVSWERNSDSRATKMRTWLESSGAHLMVSSDEGTSERLEIREAVALPMNVFLNDVRIPFDFDRADATYVATRFQPMLASAQHSRDRMKTIWQLQPEFDPGLDTRRDTFCFQTRQGSVGLLQILNAETNPRGVRVRYKLVRNGEAVQLPDDPIATTNLSFGPVVERVISTEPPGGYDLDNHRFNAVAAEEIAKDPKWSQQISNDLIFLQPDGSNAVATSGLIFVDARPKEVGASWWQMSAPELLSSPEFKSMIQETAEQAAVAGANVRWRETRNMTGAEDRPTYLFKTREDGMGVLQITGFTKDPRGVKIRYKLVQSETTNATAADEFREYPVNKTFAELARTTNPTTPESVQAVAAIGIMEGDPATILRRYTLYLMTFPAGSVNLTQTEKGRADTREALVRRTIIYRDELAVVIFEQLGELVSVVHGRRDGQWKIFTGADLPYAATELEAVANFKARAAEFYALLQKVPAQPPSFIAEAGKEAVANAGEMMSAMINTLGQTIGETNIAKMVQGVLTNAVSQLTAPAFSTSPQSGSKIVPLVITADGALTVADQRYDSLEPSVWLGPLSALHPTAVTISADAAVPFSQVTKIMEACQSAGIKVESFRAAPQTDLPASAPSPK